MIENNLVVKANKLVEARYDLKLNEQKIILYAVSKLDRNKEDFNILKFDLKEFTDLIKTTDKRYEEIRNIVRELRKKEVVIHIEDDEIITGWLSSIEFKKKTGTIEIEFSKKLIPYLLQLKHQYTKYEIQNVLYLKNKYSIRIYELLKQYESIGKRKFKLEELKNILGCETKYNEYKDFKKKILIPSQKELCDNTDICFEYNQITEGRKVVEIEFIIINNKKDKEKEIIEQLYSKEEIESVKLQSGLDKEKFNSKQVMELYEIAVDMTDDKNLSPFEYIKINYIDMLKNEKVKSKFMYLKKALKEDFAKALIQLKFEV